MEWRITAASRRLENEEAWSDLEDGLLEVLEGLGIGGVTGWGRIGELGAVFTLDFPTMSGASAEGAALFETALEKIGASVAPARLEVEPADDEAEDDETSVERRVRLEGTSIQALTASEVGGILGVSRQRVYQLLSEHADFPRPRADLPRGAVWDRGEVEAWSRKVRRAGRPRKLA